MIYIAYDYVCDVVMNILKNTLNINVQKFFYFISKYQEYLFYYLLSYNKL